VVDRANWLIKLLNGCMEQQTNAMLNSRLPSVIDGLNVLAGLLLESGFIIISGQRQWSKETPMQTWRVTRNCDITSLRQKTTLRTSSAPFAITKATLLTMYVF
jgi:hypothetical protein